MRRLARSLSALTTRQSHLLCQGGEVLQAVPGILLSPSGTQGSEAPSHQPYLSGRGTLLLSDLKWRQYSSCGIHKDSFDFGGREFFIEIGEVANLADGSCVLRQGGTTVLATVVGGKDMLEGEDPATLQVSFREPWYSAGMLPQSRGRRERGSGTEREILVSRAIDRSLRPMLLPGYHYPVDVQVRVLSQEMESMDPDTLAINAASQALELSNIPWNGPVGAVRVAKVHGAFVVNPGPSDLSNAEMDLLVAGTDEHVLMMEMNGAQVPEEVVAEALQLAQGQLGDIINAQRKLSSVLRRRKREARLFEVPPAALEQLKDFLEPELLQVLREGGHMSKAQRGAALEVIKANVWEQACSSLNCSGDRQQQQQQQPSVQESGEAAGLQQQQQQQQQHAGLSYSQYVSAFDSVLSHAMRALILQEGLRPDGRQPHQMRPLRADAAYLPPGVVHGSALFSRGETQALCVATVGNADEHEVVDGPYGPQQLPFMLHYSFPPFCTNEVGQLREPSRRELGHGALAKRALQPVMPTLEADGWPFCTRVNSETLASNGSSSMAAVCGGTVALLMAGVPIKSPVAGISIGLVSKGTPKEWRDGSFVLLTDIAGIEDSLGDMDFKVAGTEAGLTAMQLDMKLPGIPVKVLVSAISQARAARLELLHVLREAVAKQRQEEDDPQGGQSPCVEEMQVDADCAALLLGQSGSALAALQQASGAKVVVSPEGRVQIYAPSRAKMNAACAAVAAVEGSDLIEGHVYSARVSGIFDWGAVITLPNGAQHVLHISEMAHEKVRDVASLLQVGETIQVRCLGRDIRGMLRLSRKACLTDGGMQGSTSPASKSDQDNEAAAKEAT